MKRLLVALSFLLCGFASHPPEDVTCEQAPYANDRFHFIKCTFPPHISKFVIGDYPQKGSLLIPVTGNKLTLRAHFDGYSARPISCDDWNFASYTEIVTRNCPDHYPDIQLHGGGTGSWGGPYQGGNPYGWRIAALFKYASEHYASRIDWQAGITLEGCSYGGSTALLQSMLMPDVWTKALITVVSACVPPTLMVKQETPVGNYWRDVSIQRSWGSFDWTRADIRQHINRLAYYRIVGSPGDTSVVFDLAIFEVCDELKIACFGMWHNYGHAPSEPGINLPFQNIYSGPDMVVRLDKPLIIFTKSSANYWGALRGHYNLGLEYRSASIVSSDRLLVVPVRYRRTVNIGGGVPDQPTSASFEFTTRRIKLPDGEYRWTLAQQSGTTSVVNGELSIEGLVLAHSETYSDLRIEK